MNTMLISYDLKNKSNNYTELYETIKTANGWWHHLESVWIIVTESSTKEWQEKLLSKIEKTDYLIVIRIESGEANGWLPQKAWDWLKKNSTIK